MPKKTLTDKQQRFIDVLFEEAGGDLKKARELAGYSDTHAIALIVEALKDEIIEATKTFMAANGPRAALSMTGVLSDPTSPGVQNSLRAAEQILDRAGVIKHEKIDVNTTAPVGLFVLPPKGYTPDAS